MRCTVFLIGITILGLGIGGKLQAQAPLYLVNAATTVDEVDFQGNHTFSDGQLQEQIVTRGRSFWDRLADRIPFLEGRRYPFDPVELQKDVVRLRRFYRRNGFLRTQVNYQALLDTSRNEIDITFLIQEGPPLLISEVFFTGPEGSPAIEQISEEMRPRWLRFLRTVEIQTGIRYSETLVVQLQQETLSWLRNIGFAFAEVRVHTTIDSLAETIGFDAAYVAIEIDPGPLAFIDAIQVVGLQRIRKRVVVRELPFKIGDRFSQRALREGQRQLLELDVFTYVLAEVPPQPRDSTVTVRYRVREALPRYVNVQGGYSDVEGIQFQGQGTHRNFLGDARHLTLSGIWATGIGAIPRPDIIVPTRQRVALSLRQPYVVNRHLSVLITPFYDRQFTPTVQAVEFGVEGTAVYEFYPFRTTRLQYAFSRAAPLSSALQGSARGFYNKSIVSLSGTFGRLDDYVNPSQGFLLRPLVEVSGRILASALQYQKVALESKYYVPLHRRWLWAMRGMAGRIWPSGQSANFRSDPTIREQFATILFYAGGGTDVRGWGQDLLGPKRIVIDSSGSAPVARYEPVGGLIKVAGNLELRVWLSRIERRWQIVSFLDFGQLADNQLDWRGFRYGIGGGVRYMSPFGPLRIDVAYKLNPDPEDLIPPGATRPRWWRRWAIYLGIGQAF